MLAVLFISIQQPVIFADGFESSMLDGWGDNRGTMEIVTDDPYEGKRCIKFTGEVGKGEGGHLVPGSCRALTRSTLNGR